MERDGQIFIYIYKYKSSHKSWWNKWSVWPADFENDRLNHNELRGRTRAPKSAEMAGSPRKTMITWPACSLHVLTLWVTQIGTVHWRYMHNEYNADSHDANSHLFLHQDASCHDVPFLTPLTNHRAFTEHSELYVGAQLELLNPVPLLLRKVIKHLHVPRPHRNG